MIIKSINRKTTQDKTLFIVDFTNSKKILLLTVEDLEKLTYEYNRYHWDQDIDNYLEEHVGNSYHEDILKDTDLIDKFRETYYENRSDADGGEYESSMHWSECLNNAAEDTIEPIWYVYDNDMRTKFKEILSEKYNKSLLDNIDLIRTIMEKIGNKIADDDKPITKETFFNDNLINNTLKTIFADDLAEYKL